MLSPIKTSKISLRSPSQKGFASILFHFSSWYSPESIPRQLTDDPVLITISQAIKESSLQKKSTLECSSLKRILPSLTARHVIKLIDYNPLSLSPHSLFYFFNFLSSQPNFRLTIQSYFKMAHFLAAHGMLSQAQSLIKFVVSRKGKDSASTAFDTLVQTRGTRKCDFVIDALMIAYADLGFVSDAIQCLRLVKKHNFRVPFRGCGDLLDKMTKINPPGMVWGSYMEVLDSGYPPNVCIFNILMNRFCKEGKIKNAQMVFDEMAKRRLPATIVSFNTLINGYCKADNLEEGFRLKRVMEESGMRPDVFTYSVLINGLCKKNSLDDANLLFDEMCGRGLTPNDVTFTTLIHGQCKNGRIDLAMEIYKKMLSRGLKPDLIMYNTLINGLCKNGDSEAARKLVDEISQSGLKPDKITYTTLIDGFCKEGELETALEVRKEMNRKGIELDSVAFAALISGMCKEGRVIEAEGILREMLILGIKPDDVTYTMIIDGFCKKGDVKRGFKLLKEMQRDDHVPGVVTYNVLLNGLCKQGQMKNADMLLDAMLNLGLVPDEITYNILLDGHYRRANAPEFDRSEKGVVGDVASYKSIVNELYRNSRDHRKRW